jgi:hypothetical protein
MRASGPDRPGFSFAFRSPLSRCILILAASVAVCVAARVAEAQDPLFWGLTVGTNRYGYGYPAYGYPAVAGYDPVTGAWMAQAEIIRATGQAAEARSRARVNDEQAWYQHIQSAERLSGLSMERQRRYQEQRERKKEQLISYLRSRRDPAPPHTPTPDQLNPATGKIEWPETLLNDRYAKLRDAIDMEFAARAQTAGAGNEPRIRDLTGAMRDRLRSDIKGMPSYEYIAAREFIDGLTNTARVSAGDIRGGVELVGARSVE